MINQTLEKLEAGEATDALRTHYNNTIKHIDYAKGMLVRVVFFLADSFSYSTVSLNATKNWHTLSRYLALIVSVLCRPFQAQIRRVHKRGMS